MHILLKVECVSIAQPRWKQLIKVAPSFQIRPSTWAVMRLSCSVLCAAQVCDCSGGLSWNDFPLLWLADRFPRSCWLEERKAEAETENCKQIHRRISFLKLLEAAWTVKKKNHKINAPGAPRGFLACFLCSLPVPGPAESKPTQSQCQHQLPAKNRLHLSSLHFAPSQVPPKGGAVWAT